MTQQMFFWQQQAQQGQHMVQLQAAEMQRIQKENQMLKAQLAQVQAVDGVNSGSTAAAASGGLEAPTAAPPAANTKRPRRG